MDFSSDFMPLFIVVALAWLSPVITSQIQFVRIPSVIFEIALGVIVKGDFFVKWLN
jgi:Kef-type K+ transport system membrane component KefB